MAKRTGDAKLKKAARDSERTGVAIDDLVARLQRAEREAGDEINDVITAKVRQMLLSNLRSSKVQVRTGKLSRALANATVKVNLGRGAKIVISMPDNVSAYEDGSEFYQAAAAVNYGAVRNLNDKNKKRRRAFKIQAQRRADFNGNTEKKSVNTLGTVVTRPRNYWELTPAQATELGRMVGLEFANIISSSISGMSIG